MSEEERKLDRLCTVLGEYYQYMKNETYFQPPYHEEGKFRKFCEENGYDASSVLEEFEQEPDDCMLCDFDQDKDGNNIFPLEEKIDDEQNRNVAIYKILKNIYLYGHFDHYAPINIDDWTLTVDTNRKKEIISLYKQYIHHFESQFFSNINLIHFLSMTPINDFPFLMSIVDCYTRDRIDAKCVQIPGSDLKEQEWIQTKHVLSELNKKCASIQTTNGGQLDLKSAIARYQQRIAPQFIFSPPRLINDNLREISVYIVSFGKFVNQLMSAQKIMPPFMIDFMLTLSPSIDAYKSFDINSDIKSNIDDNGTNDNDNKQINLMQQDCIGDITSDLNNTQCLYYKTNIKDQIDVDGEMEPLLMLRTKLFQNGLREFSTILSKNGHDTMNYPQYERLSVVVDRRNIKNMYTKNNRNNKEYSMKKTQIKQEDETEEFLDSLIFFQPPKDCNFLPKQQHPPEIFFERSRQCLLPRPGYYEEKENIDKMAEKEFLETHDKLKKQTITSDKATQGQLLTFSFHVREEDNMKCYMLWNGQSMRFYPSDLVHVLPKIFVQNEFGNDEYVINKIGEKLASQMTINDPQFERFYCGLSGKQPHEFPIKYNITLDDDD